MDEVTFEAGGLRYPALTLGTQGAPVALCLHGFPDDRWTFRHMLPALAAAGYQAIAPALPGYAPTCRLPSTAHYRLDTVADRVAGLLDALTDRPALLVGHDWGAAVGYALAARHPHLLSRLVTLAVPPLAGMRRALATLPIQAPRSLYMALFQLPGAPTALGAMGALPVAALWRRWSPSWDASQPDLQRVRDAFTDPALRQHALAWYRALPLALTPQGRPALDLFTAPVRVPTLAMGGLNDGCMDPRFFAAACDLLDFPAGLTALQLPDVGHFLHLEAPQTVHQHLFSWLSRAGRNPQ